MNIPKYVSFLGWTSFFAMTWLNLFGLIPFGLSNIMSVIIFLSMGIFGASWDSSKNESKN